MMKLDLFPIADIVLFEQYCNLACQYCFIDQTFTAHISNYNKKHLLEHLDVLLSSLCSYGIKSIKISGGEIFLIPEFIQHLSKCNDLKRVQILTNGTLLNDSILDNLSHYHNIGIQVSFDGHTYAMNRLRFPKESIFMKVKNNIEKIIDKKIPLEINVCLTKHNIDDLDNALTYFSSLTDEYLLVNLFPVRDPKSEFSILNNQISILKNIIENYQKYQRILPPLEYLEFVVEVLSSYGKKPTNWMCYINKTVLAIQGNGHIKLCPEANTSEHTVCGNVFTKSLAEVIEAMLEKPLHDIMSKRCNAVPLCRECLTHYEVINLFINNRISASDLRKIWMYDDEIISEIQARKRR